MNWGIVLTEAPRYPSVPGMTSSELATGLPKISRIFRMKSASIWSWTRWRERAKQVLQSNPMPSCEEFSMAIDPSPEEIAEAENADLAAEDLAFNRETTRRCLRCNGELLLERMGGSYLIRCKNENRVVLTARGL
jgi:hypothetical protein